MILCPAIVLAQAVPGIAPLELVVSFLPQILLGCLFALICLAIIERRLILLAAPIVFIAALPFLTLSKFESPSQAPCPPEACLTVLTANIYGQASAMPKLNQIAEREGVDLIGINEAVSRLDEAAYLEVFPNYLHTIHTARRNMPPYMGNPITLLSRQSLDNPERTLRKDTGGRAYIMADLEGTWQGLKIAIAHSVTPMTQRQITARNTLLREVGAALETQDTFILMGDFNLTPWSPTFRKLPGKRAGDPRRSNTWPTFLPWLGLSIDHIMFAGDLELVEFKILEPIGSDHYPVLARFKRKPAK